MPRTANWDTELGYWLYCEGKSDQEIADACKTSLTSVKNARRNHWKKNPDGGRRAPPERKPTASANAPECGNEGGCVPHTSSAPAASPGGTFPRGEDFEGKEVAGMPVEIDESRDTAKMMEVIAKMTEGMGGIKAVCVGNIIQNLWNLNSIDDIRDARNILSWLEANYDFG